MESHWYDGHVDIWYMLSDPFHAACVLLQHDSALASMSQHAHGILPKAMADQRPVHHSADRAHARHAL